MELTFIDKEISEAKMFRTTRQFGILDGRDIADLVYLLTMSTYFTSRDEETAPLGRGYAKQTVQYGTYALFRSAATDLYLLCYQLSHPDNDHITMKDAVGSKRFLNGLHFKSRDHITFMRRIASADATDRIASAYFFRLEQQLKIKDSRYKQWRRKISNWMDLTETEKRQLKTKLLQELQRIGVRGSELFAVIYATLSKARKRDVWKGNKDYVDPGEPSTASRVAGTVAGALAGRYAASKLSGMKKSRAKNIGTGLGAIAGYWASGRRKQ